MMSNITPQKPKLNQQLWQRLEETEIKHFAKSFGKIWVITGPVFSGTVERLNSDWTVEIPDETVKVLFITGVNRKVADNIDIVRILHYCWMNVERQLSD